jgi:hypothetical protein
MGALEAVEQPAANKSGRGIAGHGPTLSGWRNALPLARDFD